MRDEIWGKAMKLAALAVINGGDAQSMRLLRLESMRHTSEDPRGTLYSAAERRGPSELIERLSLRATGSSFLEGREHLIRALGYWGGKKEAQMLIDFLKKGVDECTLLSLADLFSRIGGPISVMGLCNIARLRVGWGRDAAVHGLMLLYYGGAWSNDEDPAGVELASIVRVADLLLNLEQDLRKGENLKEINGLLNRVSGIRKSIEEDRARRQAD